MKRIISLIKEYLGTSMSFIGTTWAIIGIVEHLFIGTPSAELLQIEKWILLSVGFATLLLHIFIDFLKFVFFSYKTESGMNIQIRVGNILKKTNGSILVGINSQLNTDPAQIGANSIHRQLIDKIGREKVEKAFAEKKATLASANAPMGDTFPIKDDSQLFQLLVMSELSSTGSPSTNNQNLYLALSSLFMNQCNLEVLNKRMYIPLIGTGDADCQLSHADGAKLIAKAFILSKEQVNENKPWRIRTLVITIYWKDFFTCGVLSQWGRLGDEIKMIEKTCRNCNISKRIP